MSRIRTVYLRDGRVVNGRHVASSSKAWMVLEDVELSGAVLHVNVAEVSYYRDMSPPGTSRFGILIIGGAMASIEVPDTSAPLTASVTFMDAEGHETTPDDVPQWASDNTDAATVTASDDGMTASVEIGGPGAAIISVSTVESNTGETISAQGTITVLAGDTVTGSVEFTQPEAPPDATPPDQTEPSA